MTLQLRHLSSLLRGQKPTAARPDVPGLAYYTAPETAAVIETPAAALRPEQQALDAMYGYFGPQV